jgi:DNA polymerase-3 subunit epsilon
MRDDFFTTVFGEIKDILRGVIGPDISQTSRKENIAFYRYLKKDIQKKRVLYTPLSELEVVVVDIETTGFRPDQGDQILSIGGVKVIGEEVLVDQTFYSTIQYTRELSPAIKSLTNLNDDELKQSPTLDEVLRRFFTFVNANPLVAHHSNHERHFFSHYSKDVFQTSFSNRLLDTLFLLKLLDPDTTLRTLDECCQEFNVLIKDRHHALGDALLTAKLWSIYINKIQEHGYSNLFDVYTGLGSLVEKT